MASIKALLYKSKKRADGKYLIAVRITHKRKSKYYFLKWVDEKHWNTTENKVKTSYPNSRRLNNLILKKIVEASDLVFEFESQKKDFEAADIVSLMKGTRTTASFFELAEKHIDNLKKVHNYNRAISDNSKINAFREFVNNDALTFQDIDQKLLTNFKIHLQAKGTMGEVSIKNILVLIRLLFNRAIKQKIVEQKYYPSFSDGLITNTQSSKIGLDETELRRIENLDLSSNRKIQYARNIFLFSFYLAGIRISDVLHMKWNAVRNGRLYYTMGKNKKASSLKLSQSILDILDQFKEDKRNIDDYIFPELKKADPKNPRDIYAKIKTATKKINENLGKMAKLAQIDKEITSHIARHTFGNIAGDKISPHMLQKLYRHSNLTTTIGYQNNFIHKDADDALDSVLDF